MAVPDPVDVYVGSRIRLRRTILGLSQEKLGDQLGITFQQVQKYENGANRVGSSRLYRISKILNVPIGFFFEGFQAADMPKVAEGAADDMGDMLSNRETVTLVKSYYAIEDEHVRKRVLDMIKSLSAK